MDNRKKKRNKHKNNENTSNQNINTSTNSDTEVLSTEKANEQPAVQEEVVKEVTSAKEKEEIKREELEKEEIKKEETRKENKQESSPESLKSKKEESKTVVVNAAKILLPIAACAIVIAAIISYAGSQQSQMVDSNALNGEEDSSVGTVTLSEEPLVENAYTEVNDLMHTFYTALAEGDMDTVRSIKDYNSDREIITYEKKSEFIESYDNVNCYTKPGVEDNSYFVYVTYDVKIKDIATEAPGLNAFYVYPSEDGSLKIDGDTEESITAAFKLVTNQDDVVDLYNKIDVNYKEAIASDEVLDQFMEDLPGVIKESVGVALAQLETQGEDNNTETAEPEETQPEQSEAPVENEELTQNQTVNQVVRTTDTVNVRSSDSEEADKIGKAQTGTELTRIEERVNGWSKVIFEDKEAFIKSDYLEVVSTNTVAAAEPAPEPEQEQGTVSMITAKTNVNVRNAASQDADKIGTASGGNSYELIEDQGEWYKINYNGSTGFVKAEFFER